jgi:predicted alpha/beta superfamily hydrolase
MLPRAIALLVVHAVLPSSAGCATPPPDVPAIRGAVERRTVHSAGVGDDYLVEVRLPADYAAAPARRWPVVYQLDGTASFGAQFPIAAGFVSGLAADGLIEDAIVVGIGYPYRDPDGLGFDARRGRERDYVGDGAAAFLRFIGDELVPLVDADYRSDGARRVLSGHSLGGFLVLHALFSAALPVSGFIAGDPSFSSDDHRLFDEEAELAGSGAQPAAALWLEVARYDGAVQQLDYALLDARLRAHHPALRYESELRDTDHGGAIAAGIRNGLVHVLGGAAR